MRLSSVLLLVVAAFVLVNCVTVSATNSELSQVVSTTPLELQTDGQNEKRFLRSKEIDQAASEDDDDDSTDEERRFQVQGLQNIIKKQKVLKAKFTAQERETFREWIRNKDNPITMYQLFNLQADVTRNSDLYNTWRRFSKYYRIVKAKKRAVVRAG